MLPNYLKFETMQEKMIFIQSLNEEKRDELLIQLREKNPREYRKVSGKLNAVEQEISLFEKASIISISLNMIEPNPHQPRKIFTQEKIDILANSIKENGLISPILVSKVNNNKYILIAGERRFRSYQQLCKEEGGKFCEIEAKVLNNVNDKKLQRLALLENIQRENLTLREEAKALLDLNKTGIAIAEIAKITGMSNSKVGRYVKIAKLHNIVLSEMEKLNITSSTLMEFITTLEDVDTQLKAIREFIDGKTIQQLKASYNPKENKQKLEEQNSDIHDVNNKENKENLTQKTDKVSINNKEEELKINKSNIPIQENSTYKYKNNTLTLFNINKEMKEKILQIYNKKQTPC